MILKSSTAGPSVKGFTDLRDAEKQLNPIEINLPEYIHMLPEFKEKHRKTRTSSNFKYNIFYPACECEEYLEKKTLYESKDIRILCKHLAYGIIKYGSDSINDLTKKLIEDQIKFGIQRLYKLNDKTVIGTKKNPEWITLYIKNSPTWISIGYNLKQKRFAYGFTYPEYDDLISEISNHII